VEEVSDNTVATLECCDVKSLLIKVCGSSCNWTAKNISSYEDVFHHVNE
jgi:hypothetical protein